MTRYEKWIGNFLQPNHFFSRHDRYGTSYSIPASFSLCLDWGYARVDGKVRVIGCLEDRLVIAGIPAHLERQQPSVTFPISFWSVHGVTTAAHGDGFWGRAGRYLLAEASSENRL